MRKRFLNVTLALGLVTAFLASFAGGVSATPEQPGQNAEYFPFVFNNTTVNGTPGFTSTLTVQNVELYPENLSFYKADGTALMTNVPVNPRASVSVSAAQLGLPTGGNGVYVTATWDQTQATVDDEECSFSYSVTTKATGPGTTQNVPAAYATQVGTITDTTQGVTYRQGVDYNVNVQNAGSANATINIIWNGTNAQTAAPPSGDTLTIAYAEINDCNGNPRIAGVERHTNGAGTSVDGYNAIPVQDFLLAANDPAIAGGENIQAALDNSNDWVLPIVQTNTGWNSVIYITNVSTEANPFTATFYPAAGQGVQGPSVALNCTSIVKADGTSTPGTTSLLGVGQTCVIDLTAMGAPAGAVGSVWINSNHGVAAMVAREKAATNMSLTNVAQPRTDTNFNAYTDTGYGSCQSNPGEGYTDPGSYVGGSGCNSDEYDPAYSVAGRRIAPLVFRDYNGWNTGINIANLSSDTNNVTIEYFNYAGDSVAVDSVNIPPQGMEYVYIPASVDSNVAPYAISSAIISGQQSIAAVVDEVKYLGGPGMGQAMSYAAQNGIQPAGCFYTTENTTAESYNYEPVTTNCDSSDIATYQPGNQPNGARVTYDSELDLPLFQKGMNGGATGPTSGINLFNADQTSGLSGMVTFLNTAGRPVAPTVGPNDQEAPFFIDFAAFTGKTLYAGNYSDLPDNFTGSVVIGAVNFNIEGVYNDSYETYGELSAVSNNVDYGVAGDGSAVFNLAPVYHYYGYQWGCTDNCGNYPGSPSGA